ncbi:MAG: GNAT family N-acetyltransferase [Gaiellaceae bacterium]
MAVDRRRWGPQPRRASSSSARDRGQSGHGCAVVRPSAVLRARRRQGLARALLARVLADLRARGADEVTTEIDAENVGSRALLEGLGAPPTRARLELVRREPA